MVSVGHRVFQGCLAIQDHQVILVFQGRQDIQGSVGSVDILESVERQASLAYPVSAGHLVTVGLVGHQATAASQVFLVTPA